MEISLKVNTASHWTSWGLNFPSGANFLAHMQFKCILYPRRTHNVDFSMVSDSNFYFCDGFCRPRKEENKRSPVKNGPDKLPLGVIKDANLLKELET